MQLAFAPEHQKYGAYLVHYSGWEDPWGKLSDQALETKFQNTYPELASVIRIAKRGQIWDFHF